jgi:hypothetical protein
MRKIDYRVDVLRNGVPYDRLVFSSAPSVYCDSSAQIKLTFRGNFLHNNRVDYVKDELRPVMILDGVEYPLGVYTIVTRSETGNAAGVRYDEIEAYDRGIRLQWAKLEHRDYWAKGTTYESVISHYLTATGIKNAMLTPNTNVLQSDREDWDIGTDYLLSSIHCWAKSTTTIYGLIYRVLRKSHRMLRRRPAILNTGTA